MKGQLVDVGAAGRCRAVVGSSWGGTVSLSCIRPGFVGDREDTAVRAGSPNEAQSRILTGLLGMPTPDAETLLVAVAAGIPSVELQAHVDHLKEIGYVIENSPGRWKLSDEGRQAAIEIRRQSPATRLTAEYRNDVERELGRSAPDAQWLEGVRPYVSTPGWEDVWRSFALEDRHWQQLEEFLLQVGADKNHREAVASQLQGITTADTLVEPHLKQLRAHVLACLSRTHRGFVSQARTIPVGRMFSSSPQAATVQQENRVGILMDIHTTGAVMSVLARQDLPLDGREQSLETRLRVLVDLVHFLLTSEFNVLVGAWRLLENQEPATPATLPLTSGTTYSVEQFILLHEYGHCAMLLGYLEPPQVESMSINHREEFAADKFALRSLLTMLGEWGPARLFDGALAVAGFLRLLSMKDEVGETLGLSTENASHPSWPQRWEFARDEMEAAGVLHEAIDAMSEEYEARLGYVRSHLAPI